MQIEQKILKNNLRTLFINNPGSTAATVQIWFRAGSALENTGDEGIAHFLEHMFFKGTETRPGAKISHDVESFGGEINAFTSFDYTCYYINTPNTHLKTTIDILLDMVSHPTFKIDDLLPEREVVFEEYRRSIDNPNHFAFHLLQKNCFEGGYSHPILGSEQTIKNFSREQLTNFRLKNYNLSNALLVVAGDLNAKNASKEQLEKVIENYNLPEGPQTTFPSFLLKNKDTTEVHNKEVRMAQLTLCWQAPSFEQKIAAAEDLAINCLGQGETSRLYRALVQDTSLANNCSSSTMFMSNGGAHFTKVIFPFGNLKKILSILNNELKEVIDEGVSYQEVQKIKNQYVSSKIYEKESVESFAFSLGHGFAQNGNAFCEEEFINQIKQTSVNEVNQTFKDIFKRTMHISMQIPKDENIEIAKKTLLQFRHDFSSPRLTNSKKTFHSASQFDPQVQVIEIKKGIKLIHRFNNMTPTFVLHGYLKGGIAEENTVNNGIYQMLSSMLTCGYGHFSNEDLKLDLEDKSAGLSGFAGKNAYGLTLHGQTEHFNTLVDHFFGSLLGPNFPQDIFKHEKEMVFRALENQKEDPVKQCFHAVSEMFFSNHPYKLNILGNPKSLKSLNIKKLQSLHKNNILKKDFIFTYCGNLEINDVRELIQKKLEKIKPRPIFKQKTSIPKCAGPLQKIIPFDREQTQIFIGIPSPKVGHKDNQILKIITTLLSGQSSELFVEVRDRQGLCYSAQPVHLMAQDGGYWGIYMASGHDKVQRAIEAIFKILEKLKKNGIEKKEFDRVKEMIQGQAQINIQTNEDYANIYSVPLLQGQSIDFYYLNNEAIRIMPYEVFQKEVKRILSKKWGQVIVGRQEKK